MMMGGGLIGEDGVAVEMQILEVVVVVAVVVAVEADVVDVVVSDDINLIIYIYNLIYNLI